MDEDIELEGAVGISDEVIIVADVLDSTSAAETEETLAGAVELVETPDVSVAVVDTRRADWTSATAATEVGWVEGVVVTMVVVVSVTVEDMTTFDWTSAARTGVGEPEAIIVGEVEITVTVVVAEPTLVSVVAAAVLDMSAAESEEAVVVATDEEDPDTVAVAESEAIVEGTPGTEVDSISAAVTILEEAIGEEVAMGIEESAVAVEPEAESDVDSLSAAGTAVETTEEEVAEDVEELVVAIPVVVVEVITWVDPKPAAEIELAEAVGAEIEFEAEELDIAAAALARVSVTVAVAVTVAVPATAEELETPLTALASGAVCCWGDTSGVTGVNTSVTFLAPVAIVEFALGGAGAVELAIASLARRDVMLATFSPTGVSGSWFATVASSFPLSLSPLPWPVSSTLLRLPSSSPSNHIGLTTPESSLNANAWLLCVWVMLTPELGVVDHWKQGSTVSGSPPDGLGSKVVQ
jgi:hypothetical protein